MKTPNLLKRPVCLIDETPEETRILFDMGGFGQHRLSTYLGSQKKNLHVVAEKRSEGTSAEFLWSFPLPDPEIAQAIRVEHKNEFYLILIPKHAHQDKPILISA